ncbi:MAG TPA: M48 family metallopeptidase [Alphaproteobacteria bacterium]
MSLAAKVILGFALILVSGCAHEVADFPSAPYSDVRHEERKQLGDILDKNVDAMRRLYQDIGPVFLANAELCPRRALSLGFTTISDFDLPKDIQDVAYERAQLSSDPTVLGVIAGSEAWDKGVRTGDILVMLNGKRVRNSADWRARVRKLSDRPAQLGFIRDGRAFDVTLHPVPSCNYRLIYVSGNHEINAYATGREIAIFQGTLDVLNDEELTLVMAHELAHNIMHHRRKKEDNFRIIELTGSVVDVVTGSVGLGDPASQLMNYLEVKLWSPKFEKEADYIGLYLVARAGGNIDSILSMERKMNAAIGDTDIKTDPLALRTHPPSPERAVIAQKTLEEIRQKRLKGETLMPNLSTPWVFGQKYSYWDVEDEDPWLDDDLNH